MRQSHQMANELCLKKKKSISHNVLTHFHTMTHVIQVWERSLWKTLWEKEKFLVQAISPFPTMFSTLSKREISIFVTFNLSSANAFSLV